MTCTSIKYIKIFTIFLLFITVISCENEPYEGNLNSANPPENIPEDFTEYFGEQIDARFMGKIVNEANEAVAGVQVNIGNVTTITDNSGVFSITEASVFEQFAYVRATKNGFIDASRSLTPKEGVNLVEIMLLAMDVVATINSGEESTVSLNNGTQIKFDGNFIDSQNENYTGQVAVVLKHLNPANDAINAQMPGMLFAQDTNGAARVLETYGMIAVELRSASGEEIQLAEGSIAEITLPITGNSINAEATIPLWYFDEVNGYWKEEGEATLQGNSYVGKVSHFSFWNWDYPYPSVYLCINLVDTAGNPLSYAPVNLYSPALNSIGTYGFTNSEGLECGLVPKGDQMFLTIPDYGCVGENFSTLIGPFETDQDITITVSDSNIVDTNFIAIFDDCEANPVTNGYIELELDVNNTSYVFPVTNGEISLYVNYCSSETGFTLQAVDLDNNQSAETITGNFTNPITDLGIIEACTNSTLIIDAVEDGMDGIVISSSTGATAVLNVLDNDTLNGNPVNAADVSISVFTDAFIINADGTVDVIENTPTGQYSGEYQICENTNPNNCDTTVVTLFVTNTDDTAAVIDAVEDGMDGIVISSSTGATAVLNVLDNDTLNGNPVNIADVTISVFTDAFIINEDGTVDVFENTPTGQYSGEYQICENADPNNCDTTVVTLFVTNTDDTTLVIDAVDDGMDGIEVTNGTGATNVVNVLANDTLNGAVVTTNDVTISGINTNFPNNIILNEDGSIDVNENTATGTYDLAYTICENADPNNCDTATVTLFVTNTSTLIIDAVEDGMDGIEVSNLLGATAVLNVLDNDTLNGNPVNATDVTITVFTDAFIINADGTLDVLESTPTGQYSGEYQICENADPNNCDTTIVTLFVTNTDDTTSEIDAVDDGMDGIEVTNSTGAINVINVLDNDTLNGVVVTANEVTISGVNTNFPNNIILNADGSIDVSESTETGMYDLLYTICENADPNNCDSATVTLFVTNMSTLIINAVSDNGDGNGTSQGIVVLNVLDNDTLNDLSVSENDITIASNVGLLTDYFVLNTNGELLMELEFTPSDTYSFEYTICEINAPNNCDTAQINMTIFNEIVAVNDGLDAIDGTSTANSILNVLENDTLNGSDMINYAVTVTETSNDSGDYFTLRSDGNIDILIENVPSGTYSINYQICENFTNFQNCSTASVTLTVL